MIVTRWRLACLAGSLGLATAASLSPAGAAEAEKKATYLEVPVVGRIGAQVRADAIDKALLAAKEKGATHVVFSVDSQGGSSLAAREVREVLAKHDSGLTYVAVIRDAVDVSLLFAFWCDNIFVRPGASLGGVRLQIDPKRIGEGIPPSVILSNVALNAGVTAKKHGHSPDLVEAMIDPTETLAAWKDAQGKIQYAKAAPEGVAKESLILSDGPDTTLRITAEQAVALGFAKIYDGPVDKLGTALGLAGWTSVGDAGTKAMEAPPPPPPTPAVEKPKHPKWMTDRNIEQRKATKESVETYLKLANQFDPKKGLYSTVKEGGWWYSSGYDTGRMTPEAKREWTTRADTTIHYLAKARLGVIEMMNLDKTAKKLDLEPTFPDGKLNEIRIDLEAKINLVQMNRLKKYVGDKKVE
jgi:hypothetical protein